MHDRSVDAPENASSRCFRLIGQKHVYLLLEYASIDKVSRSTFLIRRQLLTHDFENPPLPLLLAFA